MLKLILFGLCLSIGVINFALIGNAGGSTGVIVVIGLSFPAQDLFSRLLYRRWLRNDFYPMCLKSIAQELNRAEWSQDTGDLLEWSRALRSAVGTCTMIRSTARDTGVLLSEKQLTELEILVSLLDDDTTIYASAFAANKQPRYVVSPHDVKYGLQQGRAI